jgi:hypothetical protein
MFSKYCNLGKGLKGFIIFVFIILASTVANSAAPAGFEPGAPLMLVRTADSMAKNCQIVKYGQNEEFTLLDKGGVSTKVHLRQLRRIASADLKWELTPSFSYSKGQFNVYEFEKTDGSKFQAAIYSWPNFDFECVDGKFRNWGLSNFKLIEVTREASGSSGGISIQLRSGQIINVPVRKEDIVNISFE